MPLQTDKELKDQLRDENFLDGEGRVRFPADKLIGLELRDYLFFLATGELPPEPDLLARISRSDGNSTDRQVKGDEDPTKAARRDEYRTIGRFKYFGDRVNSRPRQPKPEVFDRVYLYYMAIGDDGEMWVREYLHDAEANIPYGDVDAIVQSLAQSARTNREAGVVDPTIKEGFQDMDWSGPSYIAFLMDDEKWQFYRDPDTNKLDALHCSSRKVSNRPNKTFYGGYDTPIDMVGSGRPDDERIALVCENHHRIGNAPYRAREEGDDTEYYEFDIFFRVSLDPPIKVKEEQSDGSIKTVEKKLTVIVDPGGTNTGPPHH